jgi:hypothetical protein
VAPLKTADHGTIEAVDIESILLGSVTFRSTEWSQCLVQTGWRRLDRGTIEAVGIDIDSVGFRDLQIDGMEAASRPNWPAAIVYIIRC